MQNKSAILAIVLACFAASGASGQQTSAGATTPNGLQIEIQSPTADFVANAGALIQGALWNLRGERVDAERIRRIGATTDEVLARSAEEDHPPLELALQLARERVERAGRAS